MHPSFSWIFMNKNLVSATRYKITAVNHWKIKIFSSKELTLPKATPLKSSMLELNKTSTMEHYNTAVIPYSIFCRLLNNLKRKQMFMKTFQILRVDLLMIQFINTATSPRSLPLMPFVQTSNSEALMTVSFRTDQSQDLTKRNLHKVFWHHTCSRTSLDICVCDLCAGQKTDTCQKLGYKHEGSQLCLYD